MVFGFPPHTARSIGRLVELKSRRGVKLFFPPDPADPSLRHLLSSLLAIDPNERLTLEEARKHPWVTLDGTHPMHQEEHEAVLVTQEDMSMAFSVSRLLDVRAKSWLARARDSVFRRRSRRRTRLGRTLRAAGQSVGRFARTASARRAPPGAGAGEGCEGARRDAQTHKRATELDAVRAILAQREPARGEPARVKNGLDPPRGPRPGAGSGSPGKARGEDD
jgi:hypothetical protein